MIQTILEQFESITGFDVNQYLSDFYNFINLQSDNIYAYYAGTVNVPDQPSFNQLQSLINQSQQLNEIIILNSNALNSVEFWDLVDTLDTMAVKLDSINNSAKWLRSSITNNNFNNNIEVDYILKQNQTIENIALQAGLSNPDDDWADLAIKNDLAEDDYTRQGGTIFKFYYQNDQVFNIQSVVNTIVGDSILGIDLPQYFQFDEEVSDFVVLTPEQTFVQGFAILLSLCKGDSPEFPNDGIDKSLLINRANLSFLYPAVFRQLYNTIAKDDTFKSVSISNLNLVGGAVNLEVTVESVYSQLQITQNLPL
jgi:hypothetical protein